MRIRDAYTGLKFSWCMRSKLIHHIVLFLLLINLPFIKLYSQQPDDFDEILITVIIPRVGGIEFDAAIKGNEVYLPVKELFDFLKIKNSSSPDLGSVSGFFINPAATFLIDRSENLIHFQDKTYQLAPGDLIRTESYLYLHSSYFGKIFGLKCNFNFRELSVTIATDLELPVIREMKQEEMRRNLSRLKGEIKADTTIPRIYPLFKFGMADWSAIGTEEIDGKSEARLNLSLGSMIAGGEATASLYYNSDEQFNEKQQYYLWRYVNNDFKPLRQAMAGKIPARAVSTLYNPVVGIQLTNTPTTFRRSFGTYTLSDKTEPGWIVELYVNNVLVDYLKADASGFFVFKVPLVYGNSVIKLKFYGPWGEERTREQTISIPFNFLPQKTMEYTVSSGFVEDSLLSRYTKASINYGLTKSLTLGGGAEYLSSVPGTPFMPYLNASLRITNNLLLSGEYNHGVRTVGTLSYRMPSNLQLDLNYTLFDKEQKAINVNFREERRAVLTIPVLLGKLSTFQRLSLYQIVLPASKYTTGEWMFSGSLFGVSTNLKTYSLFIDQVKPYVYSNLSMAFRLPPGFIIMPQMQYGYRQNQLLSAKILVEKRFLKHAFLNLSYERNFRNNLTLAEFGFRYDFSFAQTGAFFRQSNRKSTFIEYARGSLINDRQTSYLGTDNRPNVGKGGISFIPFLDLNINGKKDNGEPKVYGLNLHANGGRMIISNKDTTIRIIGLEPYTSCYVEFDPNSFENISWRLPIRNMSIIVDPNILKLVEIPVIVAGEVTGKVSLEKHDEKKGVGRILMNIQTGNFRSIGKTLTEEDGYFSYFGLAPGKYYLSVDTAQLKKLGMISEPETVEFHIESGIEGDIADGINFTLKLKHEDTGSIVNEIIDKSLIREDTASIILTEPEMQALPAVKIPADSTPEIPKAPVINKTQETPVLPEEKELSPPVVKDSTELVIFDITEEPSSTEYWWDIQIGAFKHKRNAQALRRKLETIPGNKAEVIISGDLFRVRIIDLKSAEDLEEKISLLNNNGYNDLWIIKYLPDSQPRMFLKREMTEAAIRESYPGKPFEEIEFISGMSLQAAAFIHESSAHEFKNKLSSVIKNRIEIVPENGYYKVMITDLSGSEEMRNVLLRLKDLGYNNVWVVLPGQKEKPSPPALRPNVSSPADAGSVVAGKKTPEPLLNGDTVTVVIRQQTVESQATGFKWDIQAGAFRKKTNAQKYRNLLEKSLGKEVKIIIAGDFFRVRITDLTSYEEVIKNIALLDNLGFKKLWIIKFLPENEPRLFLDKEEGIFQDDLPVPDFNISSLNNEMSVQVGAFYKESNALALKNKLAGILEKNVDIIRVNGYYKVRITGFSQAEELAKTLHLLKETGLNNVWILPGRKQVKPSLPVPIRNVSDPLDTTAGITKKKTDEPFIRRDTTMTVIRQTTEESPIKEYRWDIQAGAFRRKRNAQAFRKQLETYLGKEVKIIIAGDFFRVRIIDLVNPAEVENNIALLNKFGFRELWIIKFIPERSPVLFLEREK